MKNRGFTLIELMIVVAIIAIIAAIAIPNLLRARMATNEAAAITACKTYGTAQNTYKRTDYDGDGVLEYATAMNGVASLLDKAAAGDHILALIDPAFAGAECAAGAAANAPAVGPKEGYTFAILTASWAGQPAWLDANGNLTMGYGISALPVTYDSSGTNSFEMDTSATVYQRDQGAAASANHLANYNNPQAAGALWTVTE